MKALSLIYAALVLGIIVIANTPEWRFLLSGVRAIPYGDKLGHFLFMGMLATSVNILCAFKSIWIWNRSYLVGTLCVIAFFLIEETSQLIIPGRTFDLIDICCNFGGVAANHLVYLRLKKNFSHDNYRARKSATHS
jgi:VanZ family protein